MTTLWTALLIFLGAAGGIAFVAVAMMQVGIDMTARQLVDDGKADPAVLEALNDPAKVGGDGYDPVVPEVLNIPDPSLQRLIKATYVLAGVLAIGAIIAFALLR